MPLTFPLSLDVFADVLRVTSSRFELNEPIQYQGAADGTIYTSSNGAAMWEGSVTTAPTKGSDGKRVEALMDVLRGPNRSFLMRDPTYTGPRMDPTGAIMANRAPRIAALETSRLKIGPASGAPEATGFPPELRLLPGDMIGLIYGVNPIRYGLHRVAPAATSYGHDAAGVSEWVDVIPAIRAGSAVGDAVVLVRPVCAAIIIPGSIQGGEGEPGELFQGWTFSWRQTLRAV